MEIQDIWNSACELLKTKVNDVVYNVWINPLKPGNLTNGNEIEVIAPSILHKTVLEDNHITDKIADALSQVVGFKIKAVVLVSKKDANGGAANYAEGSWQSEVQNYKRKHSVYSPEDYEPDTERSNPDEIFNEFTFENFIVGDSNRFAHAACRAVAENPGGSYNPLFIYGPSGLGKTHLLFAIENEVLRRFPDKKIKYIKGDQFTNELIEAIGKGKQLEFHQKYRNNDVFMVDDVQFISGKTQTQEEFFHTFNTLHQEHKQIVLTSDRPPREIYTLEDRLRSRFEMGLLADISKPNYETRIAIVKQKAADCNMEISDEIAEFIAGKLKDNIRQLEGAVKRINASYQLNRESPSMALAQSAIRDVISNAQAEPIKVDRVIDEVARIFEVSAEDIRSPKRAASISQARQVAMYVVREVTNLSFEEIGKEFGRDHSTAIYAVQQVERSMKTKPEFKNTITDLIKNLRQQ